MSAAWRAAAALSSALFSVRLLLYTFRYISSPASVDNTAHAPAEVSESMTLVVVSRPIILEQRALPMIPRIHGGATISVWDGVFRYSLFRMPPSDCSTED